jgi:hypothetical protein
MGAEGRVVAETHVIANDIGTDSRMRVGVPQRRKAPRVVESVSSSRRDEGSGLGKPEGRPHAKARSHEDRE